MGWMCSWDTETGSENWQVLGNYIGDRSHVRLRGKQSLSLLDRKLICVNLD